MKKVAITIGVMLALSAGISAKANATPSGGYLAAPNQPGSSPDISALFSSTGTPSNYTLQYTSNSNFGDTLPILPPPTAPAGSGNVLSIQESGLNGNSIPVFYDGSTLNLQYVTSTGVEKWTSASGTMTGQVISNVFRVGAGSSMTGSTPGDLVFTYQFDVATNNNSTANYINNSSVQHFNQPNFSTLWNLGAGINVNSSGVVSPLTSSLAPNNGILTCPIASCTNITASYIQNGYVYTNSSNQTINSLSFQWNPYYAGYISPQVFVATNALYFQHGTLTLSGTDIAAAGVFVPSTPEPSTLVLLGTGLGLLGFLAYRKKEIFLTL